MKILLLITLLVVDLIPKPLPPTISTGVLRLCLAGLRETRDLGKLSNLRSLSISKILKSELLTLQGQMAKLHILPEALTPRNFALSIIVDLPVTDIRPLCEFLRDCQDEDSKILVAVAASLEKSTQGRVVTGLEDNEVEIFEHILKRGISEFDTNGMQFLDFTYASPAPQSDRDVSACMYQSHQFEQHNM